MRKLGCVSVGALILSLAFACGDEEDEKEKGKFYAPCKTNNDCAAEFDGKDLYCIVSPYNGAAQGICTTHCTLSGTGPFVAGGCYDAVDDRCWLGCCHAVSAWGDGGNGFCEPWGP